MKPRLIVGNWKSNKTVVEAKKWLQELANSKSLMANREGLQIVVCAPFIVLAPMKEEIAKLSLPIVLGAQDVSPFPDGAYTGEVSGRMIKEVADWVLIGHSERRKYFTETDELLARKVHEAKDAGLSVIYCVPDAEAQVPDGVDVIAYEPVWAIGTGKTEDPKAAASVLAALKTKTGVEKGIYGGSVTAETVASFLAEAAIDGVLPGKASLDPQAFASLFV